MSFKINVETGHKKQLAKVVKEIMDFMAMSTNKRIVLTMDLEFKKKD